GVLRRVRTGRGLRPQGGAGPAARLRARQGGVRSGLRSAQPTDLAAGSPGVHRPTGRNRRMTKLMTQGPTDAELEKLSGGAHHNPHAVLGMHPAGKGSVIRALRPGAEAVVAVLGGKRVELTHRCFGIWEVQVPGPV